jgi:hypothetical protein
MPGHRYHWARPPGPKSQPAMALVGVAMAVALAASACGSGAGSSSSKQTTSPGHDAGGSNIGHQRRAELQAAGRSRQDRPEELHPPRG